MREIKRVVEIKNGNKWEVNDISTNERLIYEYLAKELISKKINQCKWITSIKRYSNYDGTQTITITYNNKTRAIYTVAD